MILLIGRQHISRKAIDHFQFNTDPPCFMIHHIAILDILTTAVLENCINGSVIFSSKFFRSWNLLTGFWNSMTGLKHLWFLLLVTQILNNWNIITLTTQMFILFYLHQTLIEHEKLYRVYRYQICVGIINYHTYIYIQWCH